MKKEALPLACLTTSIASHPYLFRTVVVDDNAPGTVFDMDLSAWNAFGMSSTPTPDLFSSRTRRTWALVAILRTQMFRVATSQRFETQLRARK